MADNEEKNVEDIKEEIVQENEAAETTDTADAVEVKEDEAK